MALLKANRFVFSFRKIKIAFRLVKLMAICSAKQHAKLKTGGVTRTVDFAH